MTEQLYKFLNYISTTSGFVVFVSIIGAAYAGIWMLFLFEASPKPKNAAPRAEGQEEGGKKKADAGKGEKGSKKQARQPSASKA